MFEKLAMLTLVSVLCLIFCSLVSDALISYSVIVPSGQGLGPRKSDTRLWVCCTFLLKTLQTEVCGMAVYVLLLLAPTSRFHIVNVAALVQNVRG